MLEGSCSSVPLMAPGSSLGGLMLHIAFDQVLNLCLVPGFLGVHRNTLFDAQGERKRLLRMVSVWRGGGSREQCLFLPLCSNQFIDVMLAVVLAAQAGESLCQCTQNSDRDCRAGAHLCSPLSSELKQAIKPK